MRDDCEKLSMSWNDASRTVRISAADDREIVLSYHEVSILNGMLQKRAGHVPTGDHTFRPSDNPSICKRCGRGRNDSDHVGDENGAEHDG